ncbi:unnamed protein product, partial [Musa acuminata var. zebrina]
MDRSDQSTTFLWKLRESRKQRWPRENVSKRRNRRGLRLPSRISEFQSIENVGKKFKRRRKRESLYQALIVILKQPSRKLRTDTE